MSFRAAAMASRWRRDRGCRRVIPVQLVFLGLQRPSAQARAARLDRPEPGVGERGRQVGGRGVQKGAVAGPCGAVRWGGVGRAQPDNRATRGRRIDRASGPRGDRRRIASSAVTARAAQRATELVETGMICLGAASAPCAGARRRRRADRLRRGPRLARRPPRTFADERAHPRRPR